MYKKVCLASDSNDKVLIQASHYLLTKHKISKPIVLLQSKSFEFQIKYLDLLSQDKLFITTENLEFSILSLSFTLLHQGKFLIQKPLPFITGCSFAHKFPSILFSFRSNSLTHFSLKSRPSHYSLAILDEVHWPSSYSQIISICPIRGEQTEDFAVSPI